MYFGFDFYVTRDLSALPFVAPAPVAKPEAPRAWKPRKSREADVEAKPRAAMFAAWGAYTWAKGFPGEDRAKMLRAINHIITSREVTTRKPRSPRCPDGMTDDEYSACAARINLWTVALDDGFQDHLRGHCEELGREVKARNAACGLLLNHGEPYYPGGEGPAMFDALCHALEEHLDRCDGHERCTLLAECEALLTDARRAAA